MSRAAIIILLRQALHRQPTQEEYEGARLAALSVCPSGRLYIPCVPSQPSLLPDIADLSRNGWSVRKIARKLGVSKSAVHRALSRDCTGHVDSKAETIEP